MFFTRLFFFTMAPNLFQQNITIALEALRANLLRSLITVFIIAIGIMALIGIVTSVQGIENGLMANFSALGSNTINIRNKTFSEFNVKGNKVKKVFPVITYEQVMEFKNTFLFPSKISCFAKGDWQAVLKYKNKKTDPNVQIIGIDENYIDINGYTLGVGRGFNKEDVSNGKDYIIISEGLQKSLFPDIPTANLMNASIRLSGTAYTLIGIYKEKGSSFGFSNSNQAFIGINNLRSKQPIPNLSYRINVLIQNVNLIPMAITEIEAAFKKIRGIKNYAENNFEVSVNSSFLKELKENLSLLTLLGLVIGIITLIGSSVALVNIMLVSVTERTREIGVRKALGATPAIIKQQFLIECICIAVTGGILGIILGITIGNIVTVFAFKASFTIPWGWAFVGLTLSFVVGVVSGIYPAAKAAKLDPIEALRFE